MPPATRKIPGRLSLPSHRVEEPTLTQRVRRQLLNLIEKNFNPGLRLPPIRQIADDLGVSVGTANQAIKDLVDEGILVARPRTGTVLAPGCTREHVHQRALTRGATAASALIRVMLPSETDYMVQEMAEVFAAEVSKAGARVKFEARSDGLRVDKITPDGEDAFALFQPSAGPMRSRTWRLKQPLVIAATDLVPIDAAGGFDQISVDDEHGAYLAGRHLREMGHTSACYVGRQLKHSDPLVLDDEAVQRLRGFERGWGEKIPERYIIARGSHDVHHGAQAVADYMDLPSRPHAVFCETDDLAIGFHLGAFAHRLRAGRDYSLVGFDKQQRGVDMPGGPLTTVEVPREAIGKRAAELLLDRITNPDQPVRRNLLGCTLFEGHTVIDHRKANAT